MKLFVACVLAAALSAPAAAQTEPQRGTDARSPARVDPPPVRAAARALAAGDAARARQLAEGHLAGERESTGARIVLARVALEAGNLDEAYEQLRRAERNSPRDVEVLYYLGLVAGRLAELELERLARVAPDSPRLHQVMAESLELQGKPHEAAAAYEQALARQPDLLEALLGLGKLRRIALRCDDAIALYERAEAVRPTFDGAYGLGVCLQYEQHDDRATTAFEAATARDPNAALAWHGLGVSSMKLGRLSDAIRHLERAIAIEPRMSEAYYALGQAHRAAGDLEQAKRAFDTAQQLQQKRAPAAGAPVPQ